MNHPHYSTSSSPPEWSNTINTPSPIFFPSASPTPKLSSTPTKKPPSPVDWHEEMNRDERHSESAGSNNTITATVKKRYPDINKASFTFDGDLTRPELDSLLERLQQSTLSADTMTSSFLGDLDDDILPEDLFAVLSAATDTLTCIQNEAPSSTMSPQLQKQIQQESDSQQLRQWLEQLPEVLQEESYPPLNIVEETSTAQEMKRASFIKMGRQWVSRMKKVAGNGIKNDLDKK